MKEHKYKFIIFRHVAEQSAKNMENQDTAQPNMQTTQYNSELNL